VDDLPAPISDSRAAMSAADLGSITAEPTEPGAGLSHGALLTDFDDAAVEALLRDPIAPLLSVQVRHLGGALARPSDSPHGALSEPFAIFLFGLPVTAEVSDAIRAKQTALADALPTGP